MRRSPSAAVAITPEKTHRAMRMGPRITNAVLTRVTPVTIWKMRSAKGKHRARDTASAILSDTPPPRSRLRPASQAVTTRYRLKTAIRTFTA